MADKPTDLVTATHSAACVGIRKGHMHTVTDKPADIVKATHIAGCVTPGEVRAIQTVCTVTEEPTDLVTATHIADCMGVSEGRIVTVPNKSADLISGGLHIAICVRIRVGRRRPASDKPAD
jgi:hypothetical protein